VILGKYQCYPAYKASGVEWLGDVPEHWNLKRLKHNLRLLTEKTNRRENPIALENIESWSGRFIQTETIFEGDGVAFDKGDILFGKLRPYLAKAYLVESSGEAVGDFYVMRPAQGTLSKFFQYQILTREFIAIVDSSTFGAKMPRVSWDFFGNMSLATPPLSEQQQIVNFLDHETTKIDTLIEKQRRLIELLKEKRQAVISHAVTKGLNPNAPMKDSCVEWLGEVPEHWYVVPIKRICEVKDGTHETPQYVDKSELSFPLITSKDFEGNSICFENAKYISREDHLEIIKRSNTETGDILMSMIGGNIGKALIVREDNNFSIKNVALFKTKQNYFIARYILFYLQSGLLDIQISLLSRGGAQGFLSLGDIRNLIFFKIAMAEMHEIVEYLNEHTIKFDYLIDKAKSAIELMQERRTALISAAVTGKIDVRHWQGESV
jgi:type I restriction enzyme S subunit